MKHTPNTFRQRVMRGTALGVLGTFLGTTLSVGVYANPETGFTRLDDFMYQQGSIGTLYEYRVKDKPFPSDRVLSTGFEYPGTNEHAYAQLDSREKAHLHQQWRTMRPHQWRELLIADELAGQQYVGSVPSRPEVEPRRIAQVGPQSQYSQDTYPDRRAPEQTGRVVLPAAGVSLDVPLSWNIEETGLGGVIYPEDISADEFLELTVTAVPNSEIIRSAQEAYFLTQSECKDTNQTLCTVGEAESLTINGRPGLRFEVVVTSRSDEALLMKGVYFVWMVDRTAYSIFYNYALAPHHEYMADIAEAVARSVRVAGTPGMENALYAVEADTTRTLVGDIGVSYPASEWEEGTHPTQEGISLTRVLPEDLGVYSFVDIGIIGEGSVWTMPAYELNRQAQEACTALQAEEGEGVSCEVSDIQESTLQHKESVYYTHKEYWRDTETGQSFVQTRVEVFIPHKMQTYHISIAYGGESKNLSTEDMLGQSQFILDRLSFE